MHRAAASGQGPVYARTRDGGEHGIAARRGGALLRCVKTGLTQRMDLRGARAALERAPLGWSYTWMRGGAVLVVWPLSIALLGETLRPVSALAVAAVCLGLACMGAAPERERKPGGLFWAAGAGLCIGAFTLCYKFSLSAGAHPVALFATTSSLSLPIQLGMRVARRGLREGLRPPEQKGLVLLAGVLCTASFVLYLQALAMTGAGAVATLRNTSVVFAVLFSWALGERPSARQWLGAALVSAGAVGLGWPR